MSMRIYGKWHGQGPLPLQHTIPTNSVPDKQIDRLGSGLGKRTNDHTHLQTYTIFTLVGHTPFIYYNHKCNCDVYVNLCALLVF